MDALSKTVKIEGNTNRLVIYKVDISDKESIYSFIERVINEHNKIEGVINNASIIQLFIHLNELEMDGIDRVKNINFYGILYMIKVFCFIYKNVQEHTL
ncbi:MAG: SDR family oxidoreductase [Firmicutes bacterium]|nr:SDR family oxidoreductase [Bacillota bacterium]